MVLAMSKIYSPELVAPAIAGLTATQLANLVDQERFVDWLESRICLTSEEETWQPDSEEANEAAGAAGDAEYQATQILATLSEEQQESLIYQARGEIDGDAMTELRDLMPV